VSLRSRGARRPLQHDAEISRGRQRERIETSTLRNRKANRRGSPVGFLFSATTNDADEARTTSTPTVAARGTKRRLAISDLTARVTAAHSRLADLADQFEARRDTLSPDDRVAYRQSLAEAASRNRQAATLRAAATRQVHRGRPFHEHAEVDRSVGRFVTRLQLKNADVFFADGLDAIWFGELVAHHTKTELGMSPDLLVGT
jgi:hypothetical protein